MDSLKNKRMDKTLCFYIVLAAVSIGVLIFRLMHSASHGFDEVMNIAQSYGIVTGQKYLVANWDVFQMGDVFSYPFIWLFVKITGGTDGIVLFSRVIYLMAATAVSGFVFLTFKRELGIKPCIAVSLFFILFAPLNMYILSYDTSAMLFLCISIMLLLYALNGGDGRRKTASLLFAGIFMAFTVYAYPTAVLVAVYVFVAVFLYQLKAGGIGLKKSLKQNVILATGACLAAAAFFAYVLSVGIKNIFIFNETALNANITGRTSSLPEIFRAAADSLRCIATFPWNSFRITPVLLVLYLISLKKFRGMRYGLIPLILILSYIMIKKSQANTYDNNLASVNYLFYLFCWTPLFYFYLPADKRKLGLKYLLFLWVPGVLNSGVVAITALNSATKACLGSIPGLICTFIYIVWIYETFERKKTAGSLKKAGPLIVLFAVFINFSFFLQYSYYYAAPFDCHYKIKSGIYDGIYVSEKDKYLEDIGKQINSVIEENDHTITCTNAMMYLMTDLTPASCSMISPYIETQKSGKEGGTVYSWKNTVNYYETVSGYADVVVISGGTRWDDMTENMFSQKYKLALKTDKLSVYKLNRPV